MPARYGLVIRNAGLRHDQGGLVHVTVDRGRIATITADPVEGEQQVDAEGNLVTPSFVDAHLHLCKVYTLPMAGEEALRLYTAGDMGQAMAAVELVAAVKARYEAGWIYENARRALLEGLRHGVTHVLAFADVDTRARLEGVKALSKLREELAGLMDVRVVAFPEGGVLRDPGAAEYGREALALGADAVGGSPGSSTATARRRSTSGGCWTWRRSSTATWACWWTTRAAPRCARRRCSRSPPWRGDGPAGSSPATRGR